MIITKLDLTAFGPFTKRTLRFDPAAANVHLVFGRNEAGKSSALRALRDALYGIHSRSTDNFIHDHKLMRIGFAVQRRDGESVELIRRKGNSNTLLNADNEPFDENKFQGWLSGIDRNAFETIFGIDYETLVKGGREFVQLQGRIGESLFSAATGATQLREVQRTLDAEAESLFKPTGSVPKLNAALRELNNLNKESRESLMSSGAYDKLRRESDEVRATLAEIDSQLKRVRADLDWSERLDQALPQLSQLREHRQRLSARASTRRLRPAFDRECREAKLQVDRAEQTLRADQETLLQLQSAAHGLTPAQDMLALKEQIRPLSDRVGSFRKALFDLEQLRTRAAARRAEGEALLRRLRPDLPFEQADSLDLSGRAESRIKRLAADHARLVGGRQQAAESLEKAESQLRAAVRELESLGAGTELHGFQLAVGFVKESGPLEQRRDEARRRVRRGWDELRTKLGQLGRWDGDAERLDQLRLPSAATIARHEKNIADARRQLSEIQARSRSLDSQLADFEVALETLRGAGGDIPTESRLADSRGDRDATWRAVRNALETGRLDASSLPSRANTSLPAGHTELAETYEALVAEADGIVDRIRREQQRVVEQARLVAEQSRVRRERSETENQATLAVSSVEATESEWRSLWTALAIEPATPAEMRDWRNELETLRGQIPNLRQLAVEAEQLERQITDARDRLDAALVTAGLPPLSSHESLKEAIARGDSWLGEQRNLANRRLELQTKRTQTQSELETLNAKRMTLDAELDAWRNQWRDAIEPLGLEPDATVSVVEDFLRDCGELKIIRRDLHGRDGLFERIAGIESDSRAFEAETRRLAAACGVEGIGGPDGRGSGREMSVLDVGQSLAKLADTLLERLRVAESVETRAREVATKIADAERKVADGRHSLMERESILRSLCEEAGVDSPGALEEAWQQSEERRFAEERVGELENSLHRLAGGRSLDEFEQQAIGADPSELRTRIATLRGEAERYDGRRQELLQTVGRHAAELERMEAGTQSLDVNARSQATLAGIEELVVEYARAKLAAAVLHRAIDQFARENKAPMLDKASGYFRSLTAGAFSELRIDYNDKDEPVLMAERTQAGDKPALVGVEAMSEGTADQLFFAMRLAFLDLWMQRHEPLPLVVDDVLIKFDDDRALATLRTLVDFSRYTQVIMFTH
ncbi:MAG: AAA family ATPase, partial [Planctomycetota bacterium]